jgi:tetratricopeptide (TPR) repeat protein
MDKKKKLTNILECKGIKYIEKYTYDVIDKVIRLFEHNIIDKDDTNSNYLNYVGLYYHKVRPFRYDLMMKYYLMAIEKGNDMAMYNYGNYYENIDNGIMVKYYLMAIEKGNESAMIDYANYLKNVKNDYVGMEKYLIMACEKNNCTALYVLGNYYSYVKKYNKMVMCYINILLYDHSLTYSYGLKNLLYNKKNKICLTYEDMTNIIININKRSLIYNNFDTCSTLYEFFRTNKLLNVTWIIDNSQYHNVIRQIITKKSDFYKYVDIYELSMCY